MPYFRQPTILQPPPRSLVREIVPRRRGVGRYRGMGQGDECPSEEQLLGIADMSDPCQNPSSGSMLAPGTTAAVSQPTASQIISSIFTAPGVISSAGGVTPAPTQTFGQWVQANPILFWGGVGALGLVLLSGGRR